MGLRPHPDQPHSHFGARQAWAPGWPSGSVRHAFHTTPVGAVHYVVGGDPAAAAPFVYPGRPGATILHVWPQNPFQNPFMHYT